MAVHRIDLDKYSLSGTLGMGGMGLGDFNGMNGLNGIDGLNGINGGDFAGINVSGLGNLNNAASTDKSRLFSMFGATGGALGGAS